MVRSESRKSPAANETEDSIPPIQPVAGTCAAHTSNAILPQLIACRKEMAAEWQLGGYSEIPFSKSFALLCQHFLKQASNATYARSSSHHVLLILHGPVVRPQYQAFTNAPSHYQHVLRILVQIYHYWRYGYVRCFGLRNRSNFVLICRE